MITYELTMCILSKYIRVMILLLLERCCLPINFFHTQCTPTPADRIKTNKTKAHENLNFDLQNRRSSYIDKF